MKGSPERNRASRGLGLGVVLQCRLLQMAIKNGRRGNLISSPNERIEAPLPAGTPRCYKNPTP